MNQEREWLEATGNWVELVNAMRDPAENPKQVLANILAEYYADTCQNNLVEGTIGTAHSSPENCPIWYDGCHCTVDALRENIARAECLEKHYGPCSICFGTGTYDNDICPDCHGSGLCGCGACTDLYIKKLQDEINRNKKENNGQQDK